MEKTVIIPHFKNGKITAYAVSQFIKYKGGHNLKIVVVDNSYPDKSIDYLKPFHDEIKILLPDTEKIISHGTAYDLAVKNSTSDYIICSESDSFPNSEHYLNYIDDIIYNGYDYAGSMLMLSGGTYIHPAGMMFKRQLWQEAKEIIDNGGYSYFPNMSRRDGKFDYHVMIHNSVLDKVLNNPNEYMELSSSYKTLSKTQIIDIQKHYSSIVCPFHSGLGMIDESVGNYGNRRVELDVPNIILTGRKKIVYRVGYEPGQAFCYMMYALNKKIKIIPTSVEWIKNREGQQQQSTTMENGFTHIWAGSSFLDMKGTDFNDVYEFKKNQIDELYNTLPEHLKVKI